MNNEKEKISSGILMFSVTCYMQSSSMLSGFTSTITSQDTWISVLTGFIEALPILWIYMKLVTLFPGKSIIEINECVFGKVIGKVFSVLYVYFFFSLTFLNGDVLSGFVVGSILPETPRVAIIIAFVLLCVYTVRKGIEPLARCSTLFVIIMFAMLLFNSMLLIQNMKLSNFLPMLSLPIKNYVQATQTQTFLPFGDILVFFMLFPNLQNSNNIKKPFLKGFLIGAATVLLVVLRDTAVLGPAISMVSNPSFESVRLINIADTLTRLEIINATILISLLFFKISILFYATVKGISQIFKLQSYKSLVPTVGALIVVFTFIVFKSSMEHAIWGMDFAAFSGMFFELILPLITLIVLTLKGIFKNKEVKTA